MPRSPWVSSVEVCSELGISQVTLDLWREIGYLKSGTHWRSIYKQYSSKTNSEFIYHLDWCKEEMEYWKSHHAQIKGMVA